MAHISLSSKRCFKDTQWEVSRSVDKRSVTSDRYLSSQPGHGFAISVFCLWAKLFIVLSFVYIEFFIISCNRAVYLPVMLTAVV